MEIEKVKIGSERGILIAEHDWKQIVERLEDADDLIAYYEAKQNDDGTRYTLEEVKAKFAEKDKLNS